MIKEHNYSENFKREKFMNIQINEKKPNLQNNHISLNALRNIYIYDKIDVSVFGISRVLFILFFKYKINIEKNVYVYNNYKEVKAINVPQYF